MKIKKAIVLAAGHGTRLRPFTCATPKPLMPVWGEPMLGRIVAMLREWGVDDIAFNTHCLHEQVKAWADGYRRGAAAAGDKVKPHAERAGGSVADGEQCHSSDEVRRLTS